MPKRIAGNVFVSSGMFHTALDSPSEEAIQEAPRRGRSDVDLQVLYSGAPKGSTAFRIGLLFGTGGPVKTIRACRDASCVSPKTQRREAGPANATAANFTSGLFQWSREVYDLSSATSE